MFTDEDLKRLKEILSGPEIFFHEVPAIFDRVNDLIARLEASEQRGDMAMRFIDRSTLPKSVGLLNADLAWRKACGRK